MGPTRQTNTEVRVAAGGERRRARGEEGGRGGVGTRSPLGGPLSSGFPLGGEGSSKQQGLQLRHQ